MSSESRIKHILPALYVAGLAAMLSACGGSSSNVSPGQIVVPPNGGGPVTPPVEPPTTPPGGGDTVASIIPSALSGAIYDSGESVNGKPVYTIDVTALPGGKLDPSGLLLGNDYIFRIEGGALRINRN